MPFSLFHFLLITSHYTTLCIIKYASKCFLYHHKLFDTYSALHFCSIRIIHKYFHIKVNKQELFMRHISIYVNFETLILCFIKIVMSHYCEMFYEIFKDDFLSRCEDIQRCGECDIIKRCIRF